MSASSIGSLLSTGSCFTGIGISFSARQQETLATPTNRSPCVWYKDICESLFMYHGGVHHFDAVTSGSAVHQQEFWAHSSSALTFTAFCCLLVTHLFLSLVSLTCTRARTHAHTLRQAYCRPSTQAEIHQRRCNRVGGRSDSN